MTMNIAPIARLTTAQPTARITPTADATGSGFANLVNGALDTVASQQAGADKLAEQAATGQLKDPHEYMIAATEASLSTELTVAVRNKAVEAFNDIMRMSL